MRAWRRLVGTARRYGERPLQPVRDLDLALAATRGRIMPPGQSDRDSDLWAPLKLAREFGPLLAVDRAAAAPELLALCASVEPHLTPPGAADEANAVRTPAHPRRHRRVGVMPSTVSNHYGDLANAPVAARREGVGSDGDFVLRQRSLGRSWQTISTMLGRSVLDLRRAFDPTWSDSWASAPVVSAPKPAAAGRTGLSSRRLRLLDAIEGGAITSRTIADRLETDSSSVSTELNRMRAEGLIRSDSGSGAPFGRGARLTWALERSGALMLIKARKAARG